MKKNFKNELMKDFNESYNFEPNMDKIHQMINPINKKDRRRFDIFGYWRRLCYGLVAAMILLIITVTLIFIFVPLKGYNTFGDDVVTDEFEDFVYDYTGSDQLECTYSIKINMYDSIHIFKKDYVKKEEKIIIYFYIIKSKFKLTNTYLFVNDNKELITKDSYGILFESSEENPILEFYIEINGVLKEYKLS